MAPSPKKGALSCDDREALQLESKTMWMQVRGLNLLDSPPLH